MQRPLTPEQLQQMVEERRKTAAQLSQELEEMARERPRHMDQPLPEELA